MPLAKKPLQRGFADIASLSVLGFLVISFIVGTIAVVQRDRKFDIRQKAAYGGFACSNGQCVTGSDFATLDDCLLACQRPPPQTCTPGAAQCADNFTREVCNSSGTGWDANACAYGCSNGSCLSGRICTPGQSQCSGGTLQTCNSDGSGWNEATCAYGCNGNSCISQPPTICTPKQRTCSGSSVQTCNSSGTAWDTGFCAYGCSGNDCASAPTQICSPGESRCSGDTLSTCKSDGSGWNEATCAYGCGGNGCNSAPTASPIVQYGYECQNNQCVRVAGGAESLTDCSASCGVAVQTPPPTQSTPPIVTTSGPVCGNCSCETDKGETIFSCYSDCNPIGCTTSTQTTSTTPLTPEEQRLASENKYDPNAIPPPVIENSPSPSPATTLSPFATIINNFTTAVNQLKSMVSAITNPVSNLINSMSTTFGGQPIIQNPPPQSAPAPVPATGQQTTGSFTTGGTGAGSYRLVCGENKDTGQEACYRISTTQTVANIKGYCEQFNWKDCDNFTFRGADGAAIVNITTYGTLKVGDLSAVTVYRNTINSQLSGLTANVGCDSSTSDAIRTSCQQQQQAAQQIASTGGTKENPCTLSASACNQIKIDAQKALVVLTTERLSLETQKTCGSFDITCIANKLNVQTQLNIGLSTGQFVGAAVCSDPTACKEAAASTLAQAELEKTTRLYQEAQKCQATALANGSLEAVDACGTIAVDANQKVQAAQNGTFGTVNCIQLSSAACTQLKDAARSIKLSYQTDQIVESVTAPCYASAEECTKLLAANVQRVVNIAQTGQPGVSFCAANDLECQKLQGDVSCTTSFCQQNKAKAINALSVYQAEQFNQSTAQILDCYKASGGVTETAVECAKQEQTIKANFIGNSNKIIGANGDIILDCANISQSTCDNLRLSADMTVKSYELSKITATAVSGTCIVNGKTTTGDCSGNARATLNCVAASGQLDKCSSNPNFIDEIISQTCTSTDLACEKQQLLRYGQATAADPYANQLKIQAGTAIATADSVTIKQQAVSAAICTPNAGGEERKTCAAQLADAQTQITKLAETCGGLSGVACDTYQKKIIETQTIIKNIADNTIKIQNTLNDIQQKQQVIVDAALLKSCPDRTRCGQIASNTLAELQKLIDQCGGLTGVACDLVKQQSQAAYVSGKSVAENAVKIGETLDALTKLRSDTIAGVSCGGSTQDRTICDAQLNTAKQQIDVFTKECAGLTDSACDFIKQQANGALQAVNELAAQREQVRIQLTEVQKKQQEITDAALLKSCPDRTRCSQIASSILGELQQLVDQCSGLTGVACELVKQQSQSAFTTGKVLAENAVKIGDTLDVLTKLRTEVINGTSCGGSTQDRAICDAQLNTAKQQIDVLSKECASLTSAACDFIKQQAGSVLQAANELSNQREQVRIQLGLIQQKQQEITKAALLKSCPDRTRCGQIASSTLTQLQQLVDQCAGLSGAACNLIKQQSQTAFTSSKSIAENAFKIGETIDSLNKLRSDVFAGAACGGSSQDRAICDAQLNTAKQQIDTLAKECAGLTSGACELIKQQASSALQSANELSAQREQLRIQTAKLQLLEISNTTGVLCAQGENLKDCDAGLQEAQNQLSQLKDTCAGLTGAACDFIKQQAGTQLDQAKQLSQQQQIIRGQIAQINTLQSAVLADINSGRCGTRAGILCLENQAKLKQLAESCTNLNDLACNLVKPQAQQALTLTTITAAAFEYRNQNTLAIQTLTADRVKLNECARAQEVTPECQELNRLIEAQKSPFTQIADKTCAATDYTCLGQKQAATGLLLESQIVATTNFFTSGRLGLSEDLASAKLAERSACTNPTNPDPNASVNAGCVQARATLQKVETQIDQYRFAKCDSTDAACIAAKQAMENINFNALISFNAKVYTQDHQVGIDELQKFRNNYRIECSAANKRDTPDCRNLETFINVDKSTQELTSDANANCVVTDAACLGRKLAAQSLLNRSDGTAFAAAIQPTIDSFNSNLLCTSAECASKRAAAQTEITNFASQCKSLTAEAQSICSQQVQIALDQMSVLLTQRDSLLARNNQVQQLVANIDKYTNNCPSNVGITECQRRRANFQNQLDALKTDCGSLTGTACQFGKNIGATGLNIATAVIVQGDPNFELNQLAREYAACIPKRDTPGACGTGKEAQLATQIATITNTCSGRVGETNISYSASLCTVVQNTVGPNGSTAVINALTNSYLEKSCPPLSNGSQDEPCIAQRNEYRYQLERIAQSGVIADTFAGIECQTQACKDQVKQTAADKILRYEVARVATTGQIAQNSVAAGYQFADCVNHDPNNCFLFSAEHPEGEKLTLDQIDARIHLIVDEQKGIDERKQLLGEALAGVEGKYVTRSWTDKVIAIQNGVPEICVRSNTAECQWVSISSKGTGGDGSQGSPYSLNVMASDVILRKLNEIDQMKGLDERTRAFSNLIAGTGCDSLTVKKPSNEELTTCIVGNRIASGDVDILVSTILEGDKNLTFQQRTALAKALVIDKRANLVTLNTNILNEEANINNQLLADSIRRQYYSSGNYSLEGFMATELAANSMAAGGIAGLQQLAVQSQAANLTLQSLGTGVNKAVSLQGGSLDLRNAAAAATIALFGNTAVKTSAAIQDVGYYSPLLNPTLYANNPQYSDFYNRQLGISQTNAVFGALDISSQIVNTALAGGAAFKAAGGLVTAISSNAGPRAIAEQALSIPLSASIFSSRLAGESFDSYVVRFAQTKALMEVAGHSGQLAGEVAGGACKDILGCTDFATNTAQYLASLAGTGLAFKTAHEFGLGPRITLEEGTTGQPGATVIERPPLTAEEQAAMRKNRNEVLKNLSNYTNNLAPEFQKTNPELFEKYNRLNQEFNIAYSQGDIAKADILTQQINAELARDFNFRPATEQPVATTTRTAPVTTESVARQQLLLLGTGEFANQPTSPRTVAEMAQLPLLQLESGAITNRSTGTVPLLPDPLQNFTNQVANNVALGNAQVISGGTVPITPQTLVPTLPENIHLANAPYNFTNIGTQLPSGTNLFDIAYDANGLPISTVTSGALTAPIQIPTQPQLTLPTQPLAIPTNAFVVSGTGVLGTNNFLAGSLNYPQSFLVSANDPNLVNHAVIMQTALAGNSTNFLTTEQIVLQAFTTQIAPETFTYPGQNRQVTVPRRFDLTSSGGFALNPDYSISSANRLDLAYDAQLRQFGQTTPLLGNCSVYVCFNGSIDIAVAGYDQLPGYASQVLVIKPLDPNKSPHAVVQVINPEGKISYVDPRDNFIYSQNEFEDFMRHSGYVFEEISKPAQERIDFSSVSDLPPLEPISQRALTDLQAATIRLPQPKSTSFGSLFDQPQPVTLFTPAYDSALSQELANILNQGIDAATIRGTGFIQPAQPEVPPVHTFTPEDTSPVFVQIQNGEVSFSPERTDTTVARINPVANRTDRVTIQPIGTGAALSDNNGNDITNLKTISAGQNFVINGQSFTVIQTANSEVAIAKGTETITPVIPSTTISPQTPITLSVPVERPVTNPTVVASGPLVTATVNEFALNPGHTQIVTTAAVQLQSNTGALGSLSTQTQAAVRQIAGTQSGASIQLSPILIQETIRSTNPDLLPLKTAVLDAVKQEAYSNFAVLDTAAGQLRAASGSQLAPVVANINKTLDAAQNEITSILAVLPQVADAYGQIITKGEQATQPQRQFAQAVQNLAGKSSTGSNPPQSAITTLATLKEALNNPTVQSQMQQSGVDVNKTLEKVNTLQITLADLTNHSIADFQSIAQGIHSIPVTQNQTQTFRVGLTGQTFNVGDPNGFVELSVKPDGTTTAKVLADAPVKIYKTGDPDPLIIGQTVSVQPGQSLRFGDSNTVSPRLQLSVEAVGGPKVTLREIGAIRPVEQLVPTTSEITQPYLVKQMQPAPNLNPIQQGVKIVSEIVKTIALLPFTATSGTSKTLTPDVAEMLNRDYGLTVTSQSNSVTVSNGETTLALSAGESLSVGNKEFMTVSGLQNGQPITELTDLRTPAVRTMVIDAARATETRIGVNQRQFEQYKLGQIVSRGKLIDTLHDPIRLSQIQTDASAFTQLLKDLHVLSSLYRMEDAYARPGLLREDWVYGDFPAEAAFVATVAKAYGDPFKIGNEQIKPSNQEIDLTGRPDVQIVNLPHIPTQGQIKSVNNYIQYPDAVFVEDYLRETHRAFNEFLALDASTPKEQVIAKVAEFYQYAINGHIFLRVNNSLFMNMVNYMLESHGIRGVEHGLLDHIAFRMQPETFIQVFTDYVLNRGPITQLSSKSVQPGSDTRQNTDLNTIQNLDTDVDFMIGGGGGGGPVAKQLTVPQADVFTAKTDPSGSVQLVTSGQGSVTFTKTPDGYTVGPSTTSQNQTIAVSGTPLKNGETQLIHKDTGGVITFSDTSGKTVAELDVMIDSDGKIYVGQIPVTTPQSPVEQIISTTKQIVTNIVSLPFSVINVTTTTNQQTRLPYKISQESYDSIKDDIRRINRAILLDSGDTVTSYISQAQNIYTARDPETNQLVGVLDIFYKDGVGIISYRVDPAFQRQGIAENLVRNAITEARNNDVYSYFEATVRPGSASENLLKKVGFWLKEAGSVNVYVLPINSPLSNAPQTRAPAPPAIHTGRPFFPQSDSRENAKELLNISDQTLQLAKTQEWAVLEIGTGFSPALNELKQAGISDVSGIEPGLRGPQSQDLKNFYQENGLSKIVSDHTAAELPAAFPTKRFDFIYAAGPNFASYSPDAPQFINSLVGALNVLSDTGKLRFQLNDTKGNVLYDILNTSNLRYFAFTKFLDNLGIPYAITEGTGYIKKNGVAEAIKIQVIELPKTTTTGQDVAAILRSPEAQGKIRDYDRSFFKNKPIVETLREAGQKYGTTANAGPFMAVPALGFIIQDQFENGWPAKAIIEPVKDMVGSLRDNAFFRTGGIHQTEAPKYGSLTASGAQELQTIIEKYQIPLIGLVGSYAADPIKLESARKKAGYAEADLAPHDIDLVVPDKLPAMAIEELQQFSDKRNLTVHFVYRDDVQDALYTETLDEKLPLIVFDSLGATWFAPDSAYYEFDPASGIVGAGVRKYPGGGGGGGETSRKITLPSDVGIVGANILADGTVNFTPNATNTPIVLHNQNGKWDADVTDSTYAKSVFIERDGQLYPFPDGAYQLTDGKAIIIQNSNATTVLTFQVDAQGKPAMRETISQTISNSLENSLSPNGGQVVTAAPAQNLDSFHGLDTSNRKYIDTSLFILNEATPVKDEVGITDERVSNLPLRIDVKGTTVMLTLKRTSKTVILNGQPISAYNSLIPLFEGDVLQFGADAAAPAISLHFDTTKNAWFVEPVTPVQPATQPITKNRLTQQILATVPAVPISAADLVNLRKKAEGRGIAGAVIPDPQSKIITKVYTNNQAPTVIDLGEIEISRKFGGQAGIVKLINVRVAAEDPTKIVAATMELIDGVTLSQFLETNQLTPAQAQQAIASLKQIQQVTGQALGDVVYTGAIRETNIMVQPDGRLRFIDISLIDPHVVTNNLKDPQVMQKELQEFTTLINEFVSKPQPVQAVQTSTRSTKNTTAQSPLATVFYAVTPFGPAVQATTQIGKTYETLHKQTAAQIESALRKGTDGCADISSIISPVSAQEKGKLGTDCAIWARFVRKLIGQDQLEKGIADLSQAPVMVALRTIRTGQLSTAVPTITLEQSAGYAYIQENQGMYAGTLALDYYRQLYLTLAHLVTPARAQLSNARIFEILDLESELFHQINSGLPINGSVPPIIAQQLIKEAIKADIKQQKQYFIPESVTVNDTLPVEQNNATQPFTDEQVVIDLSSGVISQSNQLNTQLAQEVVRDPERIGPYTIVSVLGRGGEANAYLGKDTQGNEIVLKVPKSPQFAANIQKEKTELAQIQQNPTNKVIRPINVGDITVTANDGTQLPVLGLEYISGGTLRAYLEARKSSGQLLSEQEKIKFVGEYIDLVADLHAHGRIHGDLKESNILRRADGSLVLNDLTTARDIHSDFVRVSSGQTVTGTAPYMPSESILGGPAVRADLYALGRMIEELYDQSPKSTLSSNAQPLDIIYYSLVPHQDLDAALPLQINVLIDRLLRGDITDISQARNYYNQLTQSSQAQKKTYIGFTSDPNFDQSQIHPYTQHLVQSLVQANVIEPKTKQGTSDRSRFTVTPKSLANVRENEPYHFILDSDANLLLTPLADYSPDQGISNAIAEGLLLLDAATKQVFVDVDPSYLAGQVVNNTIQLTQYDRFIQSLVRNILSEKLQHSVEAEYMLPFDPQKYPVTISQGHNGPWSHKLFETGRDLTNAIDFAIAPGTEILAARGGIVRAVVDTSTEYYDGADPSIGNKLPAGKTNFIMIEHDDGTFASYTHLQAGSARFKRGDKVNQGQVIALSGKSGWIGPVAHMHFQVSRDFRTSIPLTFTNYSGPVQHTDVAQTAGNDSPIRILERAVAAITSETASKELVTELTKNCPPLGFVSPVYAATDKDTGCGLIGRLLNPFKEFIWKKPIAVLLPGSTIPISVVAIPSREVSIAKIKARNAVDLTQNYTRAKDMLLIKMTDEQKNRIPEFRTYFDTQVFNAITHATDGVIPSSSEQIVTLKSPVLLGESRQSGEPAVEIGNTRFVFAAANALKPFGSRYSYQIVSTSADVVPLDIAKIHITPEFMNLPKDQLLSKAQSEQAILDLYGKNIYTFADFRDLFATYSTLFFDTPQQAVEFYDRYFFLMDHANAWTDTWFNNFNGADKQIILKIADIFKHDGVIPPFSPEFQYKDEVQAKIYDISFKKGDSITLEQPQGKYTVISTAEGTLKLQSQNGTILELGKEEIIKQMKAFTPISQPTNLQGNLNTQPENPVNAPPQNQQNNVTSPLIGSGPAQFYEWLSRRLIPGYDQFIIWSNAQSGLFTQIFTGLQSVIFGQKKLKSKVIPRISNIMDVEDRGTISEWKKEGFNIVATLNQLDAPLIEVGGPTEEGFGAVNYKELDKKVYVSNIANGVPIYDMDKGGVIAIQGSVDFVADATKFPIKDESLAGIFVSSFPVDLRKKLMQEASRTLKADGLYIVQNPADEDIVNAGNLGLELVQTNTRYVVYNLTFPDYKKNAYEGPEETIVFQKKNAEYGLRAKEKLTWVEQRIKEYIDNQTDCTLTEIRWVTPIYAADAAGGRPCGFFGRILKGLRADDYAWQMPIRVIFNDFTSFFSGLGTSRFQPLLVSKPSPTPVASQSKNDLQKQVVFIDIPPDASIEDLIHGFDALGIALPKTTTTDNKKDMQRLKTDDAYALNMLLHDYFNNIVKGHGKTMTGSLISHLQEWGYTVDRPTISPVFSVITNPQYTRTNDGVEVSFVINADKIATLLGQSSQTVVNMSLQIGKQKVRYILREKVPFQYITIPLQDNKRNVDVIYYVTNLPANTTYTIGVDVNDQGVPVPYAQIGDKKYYGITKEEFDKQKTAYDITAPFVDLDEPRIEITEAYNPEFAAENLQTLFALARQFPNKLFVVSAGNINSYFYDIIGNLSVPENIIIAGRVRTFRDDGKDSVSDGATVYVPEEDGKGHIFLRGSSEAAAVVSSVATILSSQGYSSTKIKDIIVNQLSHDFMYSGKDGIKRPGKLLMASQELNNNMKSGGVSTSK